jgi:ribosome maturation factor RimP
MRSIDDIRPLIQARLADLGLELHDLRFFRTGSRGILRIFIDAERGVTIADCEKTSGEISLLLDVENFSDQPYTLEVSSPGADRPLSTEKDFNRNAGRMVTMQVEKADGAKTWMDARIVKCAGGIVTVATDAGETEIPLARISHAKIKLEFK